MDFYHSGNIPVDLAERSFAAGLALRTPGGTAPLFALSGLAKRKTAKSIEHGYWSKQYDYPSFTLPNTVDITASDTTIQLGNTSNWQTPNLPNNAGNDWQGRPLPTRGNLADTKRLIPGMVVRYLAQAAGGAVWTPPEMLMIESVDLANNRITVTRGFAGTTAVTIPKGSTLLVVGNAYEEGSDRPQSQAVTPERHVNFTQIFRNAWDVSGTLSSIALTQGVDAMSDNKKDCIHMHARDIETAAWFGRKFMGTRKGKPFHTMDGIEALIERYAPNNLQWAKATTSYDDLVKMVNPLLNWQSGASGGSHRVIHAGGEAFQVLQDIGRKSGNYQLVDGQTNFGLSFKRFTTGRGTFDMVENPLFNTNPQWSKMAAILDLSQFDFAYLENRDTRHDQYNQLGNLTDGKDATGGILTSELTIEMQAPFTCGIIYNLQAAA